MATRTWTSFWLVWHERAGVLREVGRVFTFKRNAERFRQQLDKTCARHCDHTIERWTDGKGGLGPAPLKGRSV